MTGQQILAHLRPTQVEVAVRQAQILIHFIPTRVSERERWGLRNIVHDQLTGIELHLAGRQIFIHHGLGP